MYFYNSMISNVNNNYFTKKYKRCIFSLTNEIMMNHKCKKSLKKCYLYDNSNLIIKLYVINLLTKVVIFLNINYIMHYYHYYLFIYEVH